MICYLIRHGQDDSTRRGGWSDSSLVPEGVAQAEALAARLSALPGFHASRIYTSDLPRARQTAEILADALHLPITNAPAFREANNGLLAGMDNALADQQYPGLYWNTLGWDESYPGGESPHGFFQRISEAWAAFSADAVARGENVILVTHGGVIGIILRLTSGEAWSNREKSPTLRCAEMLPVEIVPSAMDK